MAMSFLRPALRAVGRLHHTPAKGAAALIQRRALGQHHTSRRLDSCRNAVCVDAGEGALVWMCPVLDDNYTYVVVNATGETGAIVDAPDAQTVAKAVRELGCKHVAILTTHHHPDHCAGHDALLHNKAQFVPNGEPHACYAPHDDRITAVTHPVKPGDSLEVGSLVAEVIDASCHTKSQVAYYFPEQQGLGRPLLFSGDSLFAGGCGKFFEGSPEDMFATMERLRKLPAETLLFCGHEYTETNLAFCQSVEPDNATTRAALQDVRERAPNTPTLPTTLGMELQYNVFFRAPSAKALGDLRARKDAFRP